MKKTIIFLMAIVLGLAFTACEDKDADDINSGEAVETLTVEFDANPTTGYTWVYTPSKEGIVNIAQDYIEDNHGDEEMTGVDGESVFTITGIKEGDVTLTFSYGQQWEGGTKGAEVSTYKLHVDRDLMITLVSKSEVENIDIED